MSVMSNALLFLVTVIFNVYLLVLILRIVLQKVGAHFYNPVTQFVVKLTNPVIDPIKKFIPTWKGWDFPTIAVILVVDWIKLILMGFISAGMFIGILPLIIASLADIATLIINIFFIAILINVILSWVRPSAYNPVFEIVNLISEPILRPFRRVIPPIAGLDLSPFIAMIALKLVDIVVIGILFGH